VGVRNRCPKALLLDSRQDSSTSISNRAPIAQGPEPGRLLRRIRNDEQGDLGRWNASRWVWREGLQETGQPSTIARLAGSLLASADEDITTDLSRWSWPRLLSVMGNSKLSSNALKRQAVLARRT